MTSRTLCSTAIGTTVALAASLAVTTTAGPTGAVTVRSAPTRVSAGDRALARLTADTGGAVHVSRGADGIARVVGVTGARDPLVTRSTSVLNAARAHLGRYGALVGVGGRGTRLVAGPVARTVAGDTVVRFTEQRNGLPVVGGAVAVDLRPDRQLGSLTASVSRATVPDARFPADAARREALAVETKRLDAEGRHPALRAEQPERRLFDPAVLGVRRTADPTTHARGVWWVEVRAGATFHRLVLVDDRTGGVVVDLDVDEALNRVVCDNHNFLSTDIPCTSPPFARTEHGKASRVSDVNHAFVLAGVVSKFYRHIAHLNLTKLLGVDEGNHKSLSSTVRYCDFALPDAPPYCPYPNAFWDGQGMFYGQGFADADDVVGHEMTHGVIQHNSDLFYWGQSGAINESIADVMGEIIDHRHHTKGESRHSWTIGEDLPSGALRNMRHPGRFKQPDSMTSRRYAPAGDVDNGGVHTNSGVGNRTFYLISQGGRQGGHRVHGIDGKSLKKSATLYVDVIQHLVSGSDYADLAAVLDHSCHRLARHHTAGMTRENCRDVHRATLATQLRRTPRKAKQPSDARLACRPGTGPVRVLFDSERGKPRSKFDAGPTWVRAPDSHVFPPVAANATSGHRSWFSIEPQDAGLSALTMHRVALPVGRPAFLWFEQWRFLDSLTNSDGKPRNYDAGLVDVADATRGRGERPAEHRPWVNGPRDRIARRFHNPSPGRHGFSRDSRGYLASRLNLRHFAGHVVSPQFIMSTDNNSIDVGWYLDDIRVYTCGHGAMPRRAPRITGTPTVGGVLTAHPGHWSGRGVRTKTRWYADGARIASAHGPSYTVRARDAGKRITVKVTATSRGRHTAAFSAATDPVTT